ncbi:MAG: hypothetical protein R2853_18935 [Thermomicrobiales bacterium]|nr:hypothetical protein [Thermomicrobiales bacterium]
MDTRTFDALARQFGRRRAIQALGASVAAIASGLTLASAKGGNNRSNKKKKQRKQKREKLQQRIDQESLALCASQIPECVTLITANCEDDEECVATGQLCCQELADCDFTGLLACFETQNNS